MPIAKRAGAPGGGALATPPPIPRYAITHSGVFHADDVFATALLKIINPHLIIYRVPSPEEIDATVKLYNLDPEQTIVYDIGGGRYDHHTQESMEYRPNRNPYAAFGKIMRDYYTHLGLNDEEYQIIDKTLVLPIDRADCTGKLWNNVQSTLTDAMFAFNPVWIEEGDELHNFLEAVDIAVKILKRFIIKSQATYGAKAIVDKAVEETGKTDPRYITLPAYVNYNSYVPKSCYWVAYPSKRGGWQIYVVAESGKNRTAINDELFNRMSNDKRCTFVHPSRFTAVFTDQYTAEEYMNILCKDENLTQPT